MNLKLQTLLLTAVLFLSSCSMLPSKDARPEPALTRYVTLGAEGKAIARVITREAACPEISINGTLEKMQPRITSEDKPQFEIKVCEFALPKDAKEIKIGDRSLPNVSANPQKIVIIGDTGCRVKGKTKATAWVQNCNDPKTWPFLKISELAASMNPDLVIHVGDYLYRESACPPGVPGCEKSPSGDTWGSWNADLFTPAEKLLSQAPWVFVRGNHESCSRAGEGFMRLLDPNPFNPVCIEEPEPYQIHFDHLNLAVLDSSQNVISKRRLDSLKSLHLKNSVLLTHRPLWGDESTDPVGPVDGVKLVFAGHWHLFHLSNYEDGRATQIVVGNSGTELIKNPRQSPVGSEIDGTRLKESNLIARFGFAVLERISDHWELKEYDLNGEVMLTKKLRF